ncbi:MAG: protein kinase [Ardenticatenaceae bacterium]|nr:protein kinase [Ardenticatenaceae bacterium]
MSSFNSDPLPSQIGRYQIESLLGRGGMAVVYLAFDPYMDRRVAVKVLLKDRSYDDSLRSRFKRESRMVASLNHPAIVPVYDFGEEDEQPYLVMRYMEGGSLRERLREAPLTLPEVATILSHIAPALDTTHSHNIIHRDLKPSNILFDSERKAYLADFGLAKFAEGTYTTLTRNDGMVGTPAYMSPEQIRAQAHLDGRTDIYALGVILFEMLAGQLPFTANGRLPIALMHLSDPVPAVHTLNLSLPPSISPIISQAMAKDREDRFATASDLTAPFVEAAQVDDLPPVEFPKAPPIILQPESESGSSAISAFADVSEDDSQDSLPDWLHAWLAGCGTKQDIGRSRTRGTQEDRLRVSNVQTAGGLHLLLAIVSDGGSSQQHGHLAAELAITELFNRIAQSETAVADEIPEMLHQALRQTNRTLFSIARQHQEPLVMQSMVAMAAIHDNRLFMAHVGNGRIYLVRDRQLHQLSRTTVPATVTNHGRNQNGSHSNHSSAIGLAPELHIDLGLYLNGSESETAARENQGLLLQPNDHLLLCTDGLLAANTPRWQRRRLSQVLTENRPADAAKILVQDALDRNVPDNVTAVVLQAPGSTVYIPWRKRQQTVRMAVGAFSTVFIIALLLILTTRPAQSGVLVPPGTATQIAQIINGLTATAVNNTAQPTVAQIAPLIAPDNVPAPGFAVIFAAGEGAQFRPSGQSEWQKARAGDMVQIGENAAIQSGNDRMGVVLSDGAELYLDAAVELSLNAVYRADSDNRTTQVSLADGRLLIHYKDADPHDFELIVPTEAKVLLATNNNVAGVIYDGETAVLELDCFTGVCLLRNNQSRQLRLPTGRFGVADGVTLNTPSVARVMMYCDLAPTLVACPTPTPAPTQTLPPIVQTVIAATETANAQTATPTATLTPSNTPSPSPTASVTPLPTVTPLPGASSTAVTPVNTSTAVPTATRPPGSTPPTPTRQVTPVPTTPPPPPTITNTPITPTVPPTLTPTPEQRFTATPLPTFTPTPNPNT